jgi:hypothetical protein
MGKNKKKKNREEPLVVSSLCPAPPGTTAVFAADDEYEHFPVLLFAVIDAGDDGHDVRGLISAEGGLFSPEDDESFIGYWAKKSQEIQEFLADHGHEK